MIFIYICMYIYMYVYIYIWIHMRVCMEHLNRCKTVTFWLISCVSQFLFITMSAGGWSRGRMRLHPMKLLIWSWDITRDAWWRTCFEFSLHGDRLSPEPAGRIIFRIALLSQSGWVFLLGFNLRFILDGLVRIELQIRAWEWACATVSYFHGTPLSSG